MIFGTGPESLLLIAAGALFAAVVSDRSVYVLKVEHDRSWTWISGDTRQMKDYLKRLPWPVRWSKKRTSWYIRQSVSVEQLEAALDGMQLPVRYQVVPAGAGVVGFRAPEPGPVTGPGHRGQVVDMEATRAGAPPVTETDILGSPSIRFGTTAPYAISYVGPDEMGFSSDRVLMVIIHAPAKDAHSGAIKDVANNLLYRYANYAGVSLGGGPMTIGVASRNRLMTDQNPSSRTRGKNKMMREVQISRQVVDIPRPFVNPDTGLEVPSYKQWTFWPSRHGRSEYLQPWSRDRLAEEGFIVAPEKRRYA